MTTFFRWVFAPFIFIILLMGMICLALGILSFMCGIGMALGNLAKKKEERESTEDVLSMIFAFVLLPYITAKHFIKTGNIDDV